MNNYDLALCVAAAATCAVFALCISLIVRVKTEFDEMRKRELSLRGSFNKVISMITVYSFCVMDDPTEIRKGWEPDNLPGSGDETPIGEMFLRVISGPYDEFFVTKLLFNPDFTTRLSRCQQDEYLKDYFKFLKDAYPWPYQGWTKVGVRVRGRGFIWIELKD